MDGSRSKRKREREGGPRGFNKSTSIVPLGIGHQSSRTRWEQNRERHTGRREISSAELHVLFVRSCSVDRSVEGTTYYTSGPGLSSRGRFFCVRSRDNGENRNSDTLTPRSLLQSVGHDTRPTRFSPSRRGDCCFGALPRSKDHRSRNYRFIVQHRRWRSNGRCRIRVRK